MLTYFLFVFYFTCGTLLLHGILRRKNFPFTIYHTAAIVSFKLFLGGIYGYIFLNKYGGDDTWHFFYESRNLTDLLLHHPGRFFSEIGPSHSWQLSGQSPGRAILYYIVHCEHWFMERFLAILNCFTGKNYYLDLLWFDFLALAGPLLLFRLLYTRYPDKRGMYFLLVFFVPTITFWCSGIRAEAVLLFFISWTIHQVIRCADKPAAGHFLRIAAALLGILLFRPPALPVVAMAAAALYLGIRQPGVGVRWFVRIWLVGGALFFAGFLLPPDVRPSTFIAKEQQAFFRLQGNTRFALDSLKDSPVSFLRILPQAVANSSFRPYPWEGKGLLQSLASAESLLLALALAYFLLSSKGRNRDPLLWFFLFYGVTQLVAIGFIVPFPGAIVRYRSIPLLFMLLFLFYRNQLVHQKLNFLVAAPSH